MNILYKIMYAILGIMLITFLWPLIQWLIIFILLALVFGFFKLNKMTKTTVYFNDEDYHNDDSQYINNDTYSNDVIDVEYEEREVNDNE